jgi:hypothetical protein
MSAEHAVADDQTTDDESHFTGLAASAERTAIMIDPWSSESSVLREKVIEHIFLAELSKVLLFKLGLPFEILRSEFDANGYDIAVEARGVLRHVQLKAARQGGKRANVGINTALGSKPGGCVVWIMVDPATLRLGPFFWFGGEPGEPLPPLGERMGRHAKGDATGAKAFRPGMRVLPKGRFTRLETVEEVARKLFGRSGEDDSREVLLKHLTDRRTEPLPQGAGFEWLAQVRAGQFSVVPTDLDWQGSAHFSHLIDGWVLAREIGVEDPLSFADACLADARALGKWTGPSTRLWLALFMEHRRWRQSGLDPDPEGISLLDRLVRTLVLSLAR